MFKTDEGTIDRIAICLDIVMKLSIVAAAIIAVWQFYLFQQGTQIISTAIETERLTSGERTYAEVTLKVTNSGKVRVTLVAGMLRIRSLEAKSTLTLRLKDSDMFSEEIIVPNVFRVDTAKSAYPSEAPTNPSQPDYLQSGNLFFDPGETIKMRFLIEYKGTGLCNLITRYDGDQPGSLWFEEEYKILEDQKAHPEFREIPKRRSTSRHPIVQH